MYGLVDVIMCVLVYTIIRECSNAHIGTYLYACIHFNKWAVN